MRYKVNDYVTILRRMHGHKFKIGEVVRIIDTNHGSYRAESETGASWWVVHEELLPYAEANNRSMAWCLDEVY